MRVLFFVSFFVSLFIFQSCAKPLDIVNEYPQKGLKNEVFVSNNIYTYEHFWGDDARETMGYIYGDAERFTLRLNYISKDKIEVEYNEFMIDKNGYGYTLNYPWIVKSAFKRQLTYDVRDSLIRFNNLTFRIISASGGGLEYILER